MPQLHKTWIHIYYFPRNFKLNLPLLSFIPSMILFPLFFCVYLAVCCKYVYMFVLLEYLIKPMVLKTCAWQELIEP